MKPAKPTRVDSAIRGDMEHLARAVSGARDAAASSTPGSASSEHISRSAAAESLYLAESAAGFGLWDWDLLSNSGTWSTGLLRLYGLPEQGVVPSDALFRSLIHPDDLPRLLESLDTAQQTGRRYENEFRIVRPDGTVRWLIGKGRSIRNAQGRAVRMIGVNLDITDQKLAAASLNASEERFRSIFTNSGVGTMMTAPGGQFLAVNDAFCELLGYTREELMGMTFHQLTHPDDAALTSDAVRELVAGVRDSLRFEKRYIRKSGATVYCDLSVGAVRGAAGEVLSFVTVVNDVSDRHASQAALQYSERRFRLIAENLSDVIYEWDLGSNALTLFGAYRDFFLSSGEIPTHMDHWRDMLHPADRDRVQAAIERHVATEEPFEQEYRLQTPSGRQISVAARGVIMHSETGPKGVGTLSDITERRSAEEAMTRLAAIVESSHDAIIGVDVQGRVISWNRGAEELFEYTPAEIIGESYRLLLPPEEHDALAQHIRDFVEGTAEVRYVRKRLARDGNRISVSLVASPIRVNSGQLVGISVIARDVRAQERAERELAYQARHDVLTDLPNRRLFEERCREAIATARSQGTQLAILFLDFDSFKFVNDTLGHTAGDQLLVSAARRLAAWLDSDSLLARAGGDEFLILMNLENRPDRSVECARSILGALRAPFSINGQELYLTASIGIATFPADGDDLDTVQRNADTAMYEAKRSGKNQFSVYTPRLSEASREHLKIENALRRATQSCEFHLAYQPKLCLRTRAVTGYEALIRWDSAELGRVPPSRFIPILEETGLIVPVGLWVMEEAFSAIAAQRSRPGLRIAVNVSSLQFERDDFVESVRLRQSASGLRPEDIELELTESSVLRDFDGAARKMKTLRDAGFGIAIDDFGTGYSSLSCLHRLPITTLKIDAAFVREIGATATALPVIHSIVRLAHDLDLLVVAEGIERPDQLAALAQLECDEAQGYLIGVPGPLG